MQENLITLNDCINLIQHRGIGFWSKRIDQNDFLQVRTGIGDERLNIYVSYNEEDFTIEETALKKEADSEQHKRTLSAEQGAPGR